MSARGPHTAAATVAESLRRHETDRVFCVAGESFLPVLDALYEPEAASRPGAGIEPGTGIQVVTCRHEGSAGFMALADAKITGRAGVCLVSRGPGAANASIAVHSAWQDATPLIVIVGQVRQGERSLDSFQEVDCPRFFGSMAKAVLAVNDPATAADTVARAFRIAESPTRGPVIVEVPEDVIGAPDPAGRPSARLAPCLTEPRGDDISGIRAMLARSGRPLLLAGERLDSPSGRAALRRVSERYGLPVVTANKQQHLIDNRHPHYAGHLHNATQAAQLAAFAESDLVLAVGTRLDRVTTRRGRFPAGQPLIHVHDDPARLGGFHAPEVAVACDPALFLDRLDEAEEEPPEAADRSLWIKRLHGIEEEKAEWRPVRAPDGVVFGEVVSALDARTNGEATVIVDSGTFTSWVYRYTRFGERGRLLGLTSSPMGFGVPAGVAAALRARGEPVIVVAGDGGFLMNGTELITAVEHRLPLVVIVADNRSYATIRLHQEREFPGRTIATDLANPDFAALATAFGALGLYAETPEQVGAALDAALGHPGPSLVHVRTSLTHTTPYRRIEGATRAGS
jgi:acetolactate synthase-1/2/3 large subunit